MIETIDIIVTVLMLMIVTAALTVIGLGTYSLFRKKK